MTLLAINFQNINPPYLVTDIHPTKLNAVTHIKFPQADDKELTDLQRVDQLKYMIAWLAFVSVFLGLGASLSGGFCAHRRRS